MAGLPGVFRTPQRDHSFLSAGTLLVTLGTTDDDIKAADIQRRLECFGTHDGGMKVAVIEGVDSGGAADFVCVDLETKSVSLCELTTELQQLAELPS